jgi:hypothetical protein
MLKSRQILSFNVTATECPYHDPCDRHAAPQTCLGLDALPLFDGKPVLPGRNGYVFDIISVLARGVEPSEFDPYTCSCGAAGCAGIFENVVLESDDEEVRWIFPEEPFRAQLNPELTVAGEPLVFRFDRAQYAAALADTEAALIAQAEASTLPVLIATEREPASGSALREVLAEAREYTLDYIEDRNYRLEIFGKLMDTFVSVVFPCGQRYQIAVSHLAYTLADRIVDGTEVDRDEPLEEEVLPKLHSGPDAILEAACTLPWNEVEHILWYDSAAEQEHIPLDTLDMVSEWAGAQLAVQYPVLN